MLPLPTKLGPYGWTIPAISLRNRKRIHDDPVENKAKAPNRHKEHKTMRLSVQALTTSLLLTGCTVTPEPYTTEEFNQLGARRFHQAALKQEPISGYLTLYEAMARALKYNLDTQVEIKETALRARELDLTNHSKVPDLVLTSGYAGDSRNGADRDQNSVTSDLTFIWNILDFGLSYYRARQAADEVLRQNEIRRKTVNGVIEAVRTAYWRAATYEQLVGRLRAIEGRAAKSLEESRKLSAGGESSPLSPLITERELIKVRGELEDLEGQLLVAKSQLAALISVSPNTNLKLSPPKRTVRKLNLPTNPHDIFAVALTNRAEMRDISYRLRQNDVELNAAILEVFPSFNVFASANYDSDEIADPNDWISWGAEASWSLLKLAKLPAEKRKINAQQSTLEARGASVALAVMTQVHVSRLRHRHLVKSYATARELSRVSHKILEQMRAETSAGKETDRHLFQEEMKALLADSERNLAYADLETAYANVYASLGLDPVPAGLDMDKSVAEIAAALEKTWTGRYLQPIKAPTDTGCLDLPSVPGPCREEVAKQQGNPTQVNPI